MLKNSLFCCIFGLQAQTRQRERARGRHEFMILGQAPERFQPRIFAGDIADRLAAIGVRTLRFPHPGYGPHSRRYRLKRLLTPELWRGQYDANVFLEQIQAAWLERATEAWQRIGPDPSPPQPDIVALVSLVGDLDLTLKLAKRCLVIWASRLRETPSMPKVKLACSIGER